jgi:DNA-binding helix-hairpin-helix protein with protein kinase domain
MYDGNGRSVSFGRELGKGGEGYVREVAGHPGTVAKVYHAVPSPIKIEKLGLLASLATPDLLSVSAWPTGTLSDRPGGIIRGILLPRVVGREVHFIYSPAQRRQHFPKSNWSFLVHVAMNAAAAVQTIHGNGYVIGDLNQGGFFVSDEGTVRLIDCDSFQLKHNRKVYRCEVRVPHYTPPELQSADLSTVDATMQHDSFGLGVLVFHLLFMGRHPFAGRYLGAGDMPIERAISERRFAFSSARSSYQMDVPLYAPTLRLVPPGLADLFEQAFRGDPLKRPQASDWYRELKSLRSSLQRCAAEPSHMLSPHLRDCPWCELEHTGVPSFFILAAVTFEFDNGFDLAALWREVEQLPNTPDSDRFLAALSPSPLRPNDLPNDTKYRALGPLETLPAMASLVLLPSPEYPKFQQLPEYRDPRSGYIAEEEPTLPAFVPETVPPDRVVELLPLPVAPNIKIVDHSSAPRQRYKKQRQYWEYRTVKWTAIAAAICSTTLLFMGVSELVVSLTYFVGAAFCFAWFILWVRFRRELSGNLKVARVAQDKADAKAAWSRQVHEGQRERVEKINRRRQEEQALHQVDLERARALLPNVNEERRKLWTEECRKLERQREAIRERNRAHLQQWLEQTRNQEAQLRHQWELDVAKVRVERQNIEQENLGRRRQWEELLPRHNAIVEAITDMNRRRNEAHQRFEQELQRREAAVRRAETTLQQSLDRWDAERSRFDRELAQIRNDFVYARQRYLQLKRAFEQERDQLMSGFRQSQLDDYLRQQLIDTASISGIGQRRKEILSHFGIETAYNITNRHLAAVDGQGFGPKLLQALYDWRLEWECRFVFNSQKQVAFPALRNLHMKYQTERASLQNSLRAGLKKGGEVVAAAVQRQHELVPEANNVLSAVMQTKAALSVARRY